MAAMGIKEAAARPNARFPQLTSPVICYFTTVNWPEIKWPTGVIPPLKMEVYKSYVYITGVFGPTLYQFDHSTPS